MNTMFENFVLWTDETLEDARSFMVACRDRRAIGEERWVVSSLSYEEAKQVYEYLGKYFK